MSPKDRHIPASAQRTSVCLTAEERAAIHWISEVRRAKGNKRSRINDILVDALWHFLEKTEGKTKEQISVMVPVIPPDEPIQRNVTEMRKPGNKR
jgi:hypothetical protein